MNQEPQAPRRPIRHLHRGPRGAVRIGRARYCPICRAEVCRHCQAQKGCVHTGQEETGEEEKD